MDANIRSARFLAKTFMMKTAVRSRAEKLHSKDDSTASSTKKSSSTSSSSSALDRYTKSKQTSLYEKVEMSADSLGSNIDKMLELGKKTESGAEDKNAAISYIKEFVSDYNTLYSSLNSLAGTLDKLFRDQLGKVTDSYAKELEKLGITISDNGELTVDSQVLEAAEYDDIKAVFGAEKGYADELSEKIGVIGKSAASSLESMDNLYGTGTYDKYGNNAYYNNW